jgi:DNA-binding MarR family transcriptional regulator
MGKQAKKSGRKNKRERMSRELRFDQVLNALWECGRVGGCSRKDIAGMLHLSVSPHLINLVESLVAEGWVDRTFNPDRPSAGFRYFPSDKLEKWHAERGAA